ncbi:hypothetical protein V1523DRAFT_199868, partial [Lipomyces doorenjongii]
MVMISNAFTVAVLSVILGLSGLIAATPLTPRSTTEPFSMMTIHSASAIQYASLTYNGDGKVYVGYTGKTIIAYIKQNKLHIQHTDEIIYIDQCTYEVKYAATPPKGSITSAWSIVSSSNPFLNPLLLDGGQYALACQVGSGYEYELYWLPDGYNGKNSCEHRQSIGAEVFGIYTPQATPTTDGKHGPEATKTKSVATVSVLPPNLIIPLKEAAPDKAFG